MNGLYMKKQNDKNFFFFVFVFKFGIFFICQIRGPGASYNKSTTEDK